MCDCRFFCKEKPFNTCTFVFSFSLNKNKMSHFIHTYTNAGKWSQPGGSSSFFQRFYSTPTEDIDTERQGGRQALHSFTITITTYAWYSTNSSKRTTAKCHQVPIVLFDFLLCFEFILRFRQQSAQTNYKERRYTI